MTVARNSVRTLALLRHAKSDWSDAELADFDRPLAPRGIKASARMGKLMEKEGLVPQFALSSPAARARETWMLLSEHLQAPVEINYEKAAYMATPMRLLKLLQTLPDEHRSCMLIGHNPGLQTLAVLLAGEGSDTAAAQKMAAKYPTAALAVYEAEIESWKDLGQQGARLVRFIAPRELKG